MVKYTYVYVGGDKDIWDITEDSEKDIEKNLNRIIFDNNGNSNFIVDEKNHFDSPQKFIFDLDCVLIALGNLIHTYPCVISSLLLFHKKENNNSNGNINQNSSGQRKNSKNFGINGLGNFLLEKEKEKNNNINITNFNNGNNNNNNIENLIQENPIGQKQNSTSFISFLLRDVFFVLNFYKNCSYSKDSTEFQKARKDLIRKMGFEPNSHSAVLEAFRNSNIINFLLNSLCLRRRNMNKDENFLLQNSRKKILKEIDLIISSKDFFKI